MARPALTDGIDKHKRYRMNQKKKGMRLLRMWVPDTRTPEFRAEAKRQALLLRGAPEELEALDFIEAVGDFTGE
jgi:hypothetical protein